MNLSRALLLLLCCLPLFAVANEAALSDPTRPNGSGDPAAGADDPVWQLTATHITPTQRTAVINASRVHEGEQINGARVLRIRHAEVEMATAGGVTTLHLLPAEVKKIR